ncbi:MAG: tandem-95 repeat protein, partial [Candidatus Krumholzibacteriia bacterium]
MIHTRTSGLLLVVAAALTLAAGQAGAAEFHLWVGQTTVTMPDGTVVPMWAFAEETDDDFTTLEGTPTVPGPRLTVPWDDATGLVIYLHNTLTVPVSLVIPGQMPGAGNGPVVRLSEGDPDYPARPGTEGRIRSFAKETLPGGTEIYTWPDFRPGTFIYKSGTHQQVQVQMGLYGAATRDAAVGQAYPAADPASTYDNEVVLFYSEIDLELHEAVTTPGGYGPAGSLMTSTLAYEPDYFLVNGQPFDPVAPTPPILGPAVGETTLIRYFNTGLQSLVPTMLGGHVAIIAEDGNLFPHLFTQYTVTLPAGKTHDALFQPDRGGLYPILDRTLNLTNAAASNGGMLARLQVTAPDGQPIAVRDDYFLDEDTTLTVPGGAFAVVVANDSDGGAPGTDPLVATLVQPPQHHQGVFSLAGDGSFTYQPVADYFGGDFFLYTVNDGSLTSEPVAVVLRIDPVNDAPVAVDDAYQTFEDVALVVAAPGVTANDVDVDGDVLTTTLVSGPANGTLNLGPNGGFTYVPNANYFGPDSFTYEVADAFVSGGVATVYIDVTAVNDAPVAIDDVLPNVAVNGHVGEDVVDRHRRVVDC